MPLKSYLIGILIIAVFILSVPYAANADDNEIFGVVTQTVEPNVLIVFDTSGSMEAIVPGGATFSENYDPNTTYREFDYYGDSAGWINDNEIILNEDNNDNGVWDHGDTEDAVEIEDDSWDGWGTLTIDDFDLSDDLDVRYQYQGTWQYTTLGEFKNNEIALENGGWITIDGNEFAVGNWINWHKTRNETAIDAVQNIMENHADGLRFGVMRFDGYPYEGGFLHNYSDTDIKCSLKDDYILDADGNKLTGDAYDTVLANYKSFLKDAVGTLPASGNTPLAETLAEAGLYYAEKESWFNNGSYANTDHYPMQYRCRQNYIILMTDGLPTSDSHAKLYDGDYINGDTITGDDSRAYLDDVSEYLYENDCNSSLEGQQNIVTYTIGFEGGDPALLQDAADKGQGKADGQGLYFPATNQESLEGAFEAFIANINERMTTFTASVVPISDVNKAYAGDYAYMSMFQPVSGSSRWIGNLKKYKLDSDNNFASCDNINEPILDDSGQIKETARSCWSISDDGGAVNKGGAGAILNNTDDTARNIYTNIDSSQVLSAEVNEFATDNDSISASDFGVISSSDKNNVINNIRMIGEDWKLGDLNHSMPAIASYDSGDSYIFVGSNDGMFHCFNDNTGAEEWAFVPTEQFSRLTDVYNGDHSYFMDGSPALANTSGGEKIVICGERRGGNHYYALDISSISTPEHLYTLTTSGQSWQKPQFVNVATDSSTTEDAFLLTGGYDDDYDDETDTLSSPSGNSVFAIQAADHENELFRFDENTISTMTNSIVSARGIDIVDDGKDTISQIYAGDLEGQLFGFKDNNDASTPKALDGSWQALHVFSAESSGKKIFENVDLALEYMKYWDTEAESWKTVVGDYVFFGTGDRASPLRKDNTNYFYCVKNDWHTQNITPSSTVSEFSTLNDPDITEDNDEFVMVDVTDNKIQEGTDEEKTAVRQKLNRKYNRGWYIELEGEGEKCLSTPTVYAGVVYFTTFTPTGDEDGTSDNPCEDPATGGTAKLYAVDYKTGAAVYGDFDGDTEDPLGKDDRALELSLKESGQLNITIAPDPMMIISDKGEKLSIGPQTEDVKSPGSGMIQFYWLEDN